MPTEISSSRLGEIHRSKIGQHCPCLNLLEAELDIGFDPESSAYPYRDAWAALTNGNEGGCDVLLGQRLLSPRIAGVDMDSMCPCRNDALGITSQFLWSNRQGRVFAWSSTSIEASL
jgi:hypothetical protein